MRGEANLYRIHGLLVESEFPLQARTVRLAGDGLRNPKSEPGGPLRPDYRVLEGEVRNCPHSPPRGRLLAEFRDDAFGYWVTETRSDPIRWTLRYAGICDVALDRERKTIVVHRSPDADPGLIPVFLGGSVLAHALTAEGRLVLHASAVEVNDRAIAIVGPSGAGKSTLAALLCSAGASLVADDALRVDSTDLGPVCFPGTSGLRLRPAASSLSGGIEGATLAETADGRTAVVPARLAEAPLALEAVLVPEPSREATTLEMRRVGSMEGIQELLCHPRLTMWQASEPIAQLFRLTGEVGETLPLFRAKVPWGPPFRTGLADELLAGVGLGAAPRRADRTSASVSANDQPEIS